MALFTTAALLLGSCLNLHAPHDSVFSLAVAPVGPGAPLLVAVWNDQRLRISEDDGVTWGILPGSPLNTKSAFELVYHPGLPSTGGSGLVVVATNDGPWSFDPVTKFAAPLDAGIQAGDRFGIDVTAPLSGPGPALLLTRSGAAYTLSTSTSTWTRVMVGNSVVRSRGDVAISPHYDPNSAAAGGHDLFIAKNGQLWRSEDEGISWNITHFQSPAGTAADWLITSVALSEDYANDTTLVVGRGRIPAGTDLDEGEIWTSTNRGSTAVLAHYLDSGVFALVATAPGPSGLRSFLAAGAVYPGVGQYQGTGILRSQDGGLTWNDNGNYQDFLQEDHPGSASGATNMAFETALVVPPDYASSGRAYYMRMEGLFRSEDEGERWLQMAAVTSDRVRDVKTAKGPNGELLVFSANYGAGTLVYDRTSGATSPLDGRSPLIYLSRIAVSPNYAIDGRALAAGSIGLVGWQASTHGIPTAMGSGWTEPPLTDRSTGQRINGYPWEPIFSPSYDGTGSPGSDNAYLWVNREGTICGTQNNGLHAAELDTVVGGQPAPHFFCVSPTPDYGPSGGQIYAGAVGGRVLRHTAAGWKLVSDNVGNGPVLELVMPSDMTTAHPRFFAMLSSFPYVAEVVDNPGAPAIRGLDAGLPGVLPSGLTAHPDFQTDPVLFLATGFDGVWTIDLSVANPQWSPLGSAFPPYYCNDVALSPDYSSDGLIFTGTSYGLYELDTIGNAPWAPLTMATVIDDADEQIVTYAPLHPLNSFPNHPFPWTQEWDRTGLGMLAERALVATIDQSYVTTTISASRIEVLTFEATGLGEITVEAVDPSSGVVLATVTEDLDHGSWPPVLHSVSLVVPPFSGQFTLRILASLTTGESFPFDGLVVSY